MDTILVLDFGSQTTQLIGRRIRDLGVYSEVVPAETPLTGERLRDVKGIVLSGSPASVTDTDAPAPDASLYDAGLPVLGICYGLQRLTHDLGGRVAVFGSREYGRSRLHFSRSSRLFEGVPEGFVSWMSHGDSVQNPAVGFHLIASSAHGVPAAFEHSERQIYGIQFHPEVSHCEYGDRILENFAVHICGARKQWNMDVYLEEASARIRETVQDRDVLLLISGGVDSTVVAALLLRCLPADQVHLMYVDTGLMRLHETEEVRKSLAGLGATHIHVIDASSEFLDALAGVDDPEKKREIIGDLFVTVQEREIRARNVADAFLAQGTLYTDMIESGKGVGSKARVIKSHHNVRSPLIEAKRRDGLVIEPLDRLYKDEVRRLGRKLGVAEDVVRRHPFPGPGLAVRILGAVTREKCDTLRQADHLYITELKTRGLYDTIWQAFSVLLPVRSVGVTGDAREYGYVVALRAVVSADAMTADVFSFPMADLLEISALITNSVPGVGRVVYDVSSKPPATIEWE
jgi:GMP synthase (glutamine-hydrolysing)